MTVDNVCARLLPGYDKFQTCEDTWVVQSFLSPYCYAEYRFNASDELESVWLYENGEVSQLNLEKILKNLSKRA